MSKTYRRKTNKSQKLTLSDEKNLVQAKKNIEDGKFWCFPYVNIKDDERFYTDNQKTTNWKTETDLMNRRVRYEAKMALKKVKTLDDAYAYMSKRREKQQMAWQIVAYWD